MKPRVLFVGRTRYRLPLPSWLERKWDAVGDELDYRVLASAADGVTEPENEYGEMFGDDRLRETVLKHAHLPGEQIIAAVIDGVKAFTGSHELQDDMTLLVARRQ